MQLCAIKSKRRQAARTPPKAFGAGAFSGRPGDADRFWTAAVLSCHYPQLWRRHLRRPDTRELQIRCSRIGAKVLKSRRDGLFIDQTAPRCFFLFFSGAEN